MPKNVAYLLYMMLFVVACLFVMNRYGPQAEAEPHSRITYFEQEQGRVPKPVAAGAVQSP